MRRSIQVRVRTDDSTGGARVVHREWDPARAALVICDMWDRAQCVSVARRAEDLAPRIDSLATHLRREGTLIVHAPGGCMDAYRGTPARDRALQAPWAESPAPIDWNSWNCDDPAALPRTLVDAGPCACASPESCCEAGAPYPWTRQIETIEIADDDAVTDDGQELFNLLTARNIDDVVMVGVHANVCILGRPYGIRQLVFSGKKPILCRDLTDAVHRDPRGHAWGVDAIIAHIERRWCPTVTSDELVGGQPSA